MQIAFIWFVIVIKYIIDIVWLDVSNVIFRTISNVLAKESYTKMNSRQFYGVNNKNFDAYFCVDDKMWFEHKNVF